MPYIGKQPANVPVTADDIPNNSITAAKIVDAAITIDDIGPNAVGNSEMADDAIGLNELSATGTTNTSTFLRGDNSWAVPPTTDISGKLSLSGGAMTGAITTNSTFDGVDIATRDAVLTSTTTTANAALPKAGGTMTGNVTHSSGYLDMGSGHIYLADNAQVKFGTSEDLQIYHDGSNSYIRDAGTGDIHIRSDAGFRVQNAGGTENYIYAEANGKVRLYYDNNTKLDTTSTGIDVTGNIDLDNGSEISISGDGGNSGLLLRGNDSAASIVGTHGSQPLVIRTNSAERMRIDSAGKVGIGTASPAITGLHVYHATLNNVVRIESGDASAGIEFKDNNTTNLPSIYNATDDLIVSTGGAESMRIDSSGNVGIGTTSPARTLHVNSADANVASFEGHQGEGLVITSGTNGRIDLLGYDDGASDYNNVMIRASGTNGVYLHTDGYIINYGTYGKAWSLNHGQVSFANGVERTYSGVVNTGALIAVGYYGDNNGARYNYALFFAMYGISAGNNIVQIADASNRFSTSDVSGDLCVYKSANSDTLKIKNNLGVTTNVAINIIQFQGN